MNSSDSAILRANQNPDPEINKRRQLDPHKQEANLQHILERDETERITNIVMEDYYKSFGQKCKPPSSRKFGHPCSCNPKYLQQHLVQIDFLQHRQQNPQQQATNPATQTTLPTIAFKAPIFLYDPATKKCYPTWRQNDMLMRECQPNGLHISNLQLRSQPQLQSSAEPCFYSDLACDSRRFRCVCKQPNYHLFYANEANPVTFGCVPLNHTLNSSNHCKQGQFYNVFTRVCQQVFDPGDLPPSQIASATATQMSFATIMSIWILLLIGILVARLRKLKRAALYGDSSGPLERRPHNSQNPNNRQTSSAYCAFGRQRGRTVTTWLHPFMAAVNGHHYISQQDRLEENSQFRDTDLFLDNRHFNESMLNGRNFAGSESSIITLPPPKFEEIYPSYSAQINPTASPILSTNNHLPPPVLPPTIRPPISNDDLPSYEEAIKINSNHVLPLPDVNGKKDQESQQISPTTDNSNQESSSNSNLAASENYNI